MPNPWIEKLADKWHEVPLLMYGRGSTRELLQLSDKALTERWDELDRVMMREPLINWVVEVYRDFARDRRIIEVGPGLGTVGVQLLRAGATISFVDVTKSNLDLLDRICRIKGLARASFLHLMDFSDPLKLDDGFDCVLANGSLHHTPSELAKAEFEALASRLKIGGRFLALTYPKERWAREGSLPFSEWGKRTDGDQTPWAEWYDEDKLHKQLSPYRFRTLMAFNYDSDNFNWFDFQRVG